MSSELRAYGALTLANLKMYVRNPIGSFTLVAVLILLLVAVKLVFDGQGPHTKVVVVNASGSADAAVLVKDLQAVSSFDVSVVSPAAAQSLLGQGKADMEVVIPAEFAARDAAGHLVPVRLMVIYRGGSAGESSLPLLKGVVEGYDETVLNEVPTVSLSASALHAQSTGVIDIFLPGVVAFNIIGSALMLAAGIFTTYKSSGVLRRLKATGIRPSIFVLSHATSSFIVGMAQSAAILIAASLIFNVHLDIPSLFLLMVLGYLVFMAMGLAISGWIRDPQRASAVAQSVAFPMIFLALLTAALPPGISSVTKYLPVSYITDGMQQLGQGAKLGAIEWDLAWLLAWAVVLLIAAGRVFRWD
jgi:ABC-2 type transport system permease protein